MLNRNIARLALAALLVGAPAAARAAVRPWISGSFGTSTLAMGDVNDDIDQANGQFGDTFGSMNSITNGLNLGGSLGLDVGRDFAFGVGIDRILAQSDAGTTNASVSYDAPGEIVRGFARWSFWNRGAARGYLEASAGRTRTLATTTLQSSSFGTVHRGVEGTGPAYALAAGMRTPSGSLFALSGELGYRLAKAEDVMVNHQPIYTQGGDAYSGGIL